MTVRALLPLLAALALALTALAPALRASATSFAYECTICNRVWARPGANVDAAIAEHCTAAAASSPLLYSTDAVANVCVVHEDGRCKRRLFDTTGGGFTDRYQNPLDVPFRVTDKAPVTYTFGRPPGSPQVPAQRVRDAWCPRIVRDVYNATNFAALRSSCPASDPALCCGRLVRASHADGFCSNPSTGVPKAGGGAEQDALQTQAEKKFKSRSDKDEKKKDPELADLLDKGKGADDKMRKHINSLLNGFGDPE